MKFNIQLSETGDLLFTTIITGGTKISGILEHRASYKKSWPRYFGFNFIPTSID